jgi:energy-coupling factor transporter ATP-binding protein EcfA2
MLQISGIEIQNFRAIGSQPLGISIAPITILVGRNGSGKTSVLQALALTAQSAVDQPRTDELICAGSKYHFADLESLYFRRDLTLPLSVGVTFRISDPDWTKLNLPRTAPDKLKGLKPWPPKSVQYTWTRSGTEPFWEHRFSLDDLPVWDIHTRKDSDGIAASLKLQTPGFKGMSPWQLRRTFDRVLPESMFPPRIASLMLEEKAASLHTDDAQQLSDILRPLSNAMRETFSLLAALKPTRGFELAQYDTGPAVEFVGSHGESLVHLLSSQKTQASPAFAQLKAWSARFGMPDLVPGWAGGKTLKVAFRDPSTRTSLDLADAATGSYQGLLLATQLLLTDSGSTLLLEEPEANMHPQFERNLPFLFADSAHLDHQVIATTHSEILVAALANAVRTGALKPEEASLWHLTRGDAGKVDATQIEVTDAGLGGWIESFAEVERSLNQEWVETLPEAGATTRRGHPLGGRSVSASKRRRKRA